MLSFLILVLLVPSYRICVCDESQYKERCKRASPRIPTKVHTILRLLINSVGDGKSSQAILPGINLAVLSTGLSLSLLVGKKKAQRGSNLMAVK